MAETPVLWVAAAGIAVALAGLGLLAWFFLTAKSRRVKSLVKQVSYESLQNVLIPDGMDGFTYFDYLLLTPNGLVILAIRDVEGVIFGAEKMDEWVVMHNNKRFTFSNPIRPLQDRMAAIRSYAGVIPGNGYVVFTEKGRFEKGMPVNTVMLDEMVETLGTVDDDYPQAFDQVWRTIKEQVVKS